MEQRMCVPPNLCTICEPASVPSQTFVDGPFFEINSTFPMFGLSAQSMESFFKSRRSRGRETD